MKELAARREELIAEAGLQRILIGEACAGLQKGLHLADRALSFMRAFTRRPVAVVLAAAAVTLLVARPQQTIKWLGYCLSAYSMFKRANRLLATRRSG